MSASGDRGGYRNKTPVALTFVMGWKGDGHARTQASLQETPWSGLTIRYNTSENYKMVAVAVQEMWRHIGVEVKLENSEVKVHYNMLEQGDFDIGRAGWTADYNDAQSFLLAFQSQAGVQNFGRYSNPEYDRIMQSAAATGDARARSDLLHRAEQMVLDDAAVIPIMYYISKSLVQPYVHGWLSNVRNVHRARYISLVN